MEKSTQMFTIIKHQMKVLNIFAYYIAYYYSVFRAGSNYYPQVFLT